MNARKMKTEEKPADLKVRPPVDAVAEAVVEAGDETGAIRISENVISAVVRKYTLQVPGVVRFASNTIVSGLAEMIGRKSSESNVVVDLEADVVNLSVSLVLEFGVKVPEVAGMVQDVIRSKVEDLTGKQVGRVNVVVQDLEDVSSESEQKNIGE